MKIAILSAFDVWDVVGEETNDGVRCLVIEHQPSGHRKSIAAWMCREVAPEPVGDLLDEACDVLFEDGKLKPAVLEQVEKLAAGR